VTPRGKPGAFYEAYVKALYCWAAELSSPHSQVNPLNVEQFLFRKNGNLPMSS